MSGRRKRYYHKTIVVHSRKIGTVVFASFLCLCVVLLGQVVGEHLPKVSEQTVMRAIRHIFPEKQEPYTFPDIYERIERLFPVIHTTKEREKRLLAQEGGVRKNTNEKTEETRKGSSMSIKALDMSQKGITFRNETGYTPDANALLEKTLGFSLEKGKPKVLIMHTHTSEAYAESEGARTTDNEKNVVRVGSILAKKLEEKGIPTIHDTTRNDHPSYNGSYTKAMKNIAAQVEKHPSLEVVLDIHRDYAEQTKDGEKVQLKPVTEVDGDKVAQVMFVVGTDGLGLAHPDWKENLAFAVQLQKQLQDISPTLARPINIRRERFNQHLTKGSLIVEVGTAGNAIKECERVAMYLAEAVANVLQKYQA